MEPEEWNIARMFPHFSENECGEDFTPQRDQDTRGRQGQMEDEEGISQRR
jgi:hypothetical protein